MKGRRWTQEEVLNAGAAFVAQEQRLPTAQDMLVFPNLPTAKTIADLFGSVRQYQQLLPKPTTPAKLPPRWCLMGDDEHPHQFIPEHEGLFVCDDCKQKEEWQEPGEWINGPLPTRSKPNRTPARITRDGGTRTITYRDWRIRKESRLPD